MNTIELVNTLPRVFAGQPGIQSEVWLKTLRFERGKKYLISAESGCGKSSLCAYLYGYRKDYEGTFLFGGRSIDVATLPICRRRCDCFLSLQLWKMWS